MTWIHVDRNAIYANDSAGGDAATIVVQDQPGAPGAMAGHEVQIYGAAGDLVGTFCSQSTKAPGPSDRPHVWFELAPTAIVAVKRR